MDQPTGARLHPTGRLIPPGLDEDLVAIVVREFYAKVRRDDVIGPVFNRIIPADHWPAHLSAITDFWSSMLLGTARYNGRPMPKHLAIPELSDRHFARWLALFRTTVDDLCAPEVANLFVDRAERIAYNFRLRIAQFRGEDTATIRPQRAGVENA